jgi:hypothetical protein
MHFSDVLIDLFQSVKISGFPSIRVLFVSGSFAVVYSSVDVHGCSRWNYASCRESAGFLLFYCVFINIRFCY